MSKALVMKVGKDGGQMVMTVDFPENDHLGFFYKTLGCELIDIVGAYGLKDVGDLDLVVDDEGLLKDSPVFNPLASLCYGFLIHGEPIVGNAILCKHDCEGNSVGLTDDEITKVQDMFAGKYAAVWDKVLEILS